MKERKENDCIITSYAPVVIPTLNRYEHFKRCLESLERCTGAEHTDVYVGLDYPPSEKYIDGWKKIDAFLVEKEKSNGFKNLLVRRRTQNCGVCKKGSNMQLLIKEIKEKVDRYISSEDDNEFSPNFLEYMNLMLEKYKDDEQIFTICGYLFPNIVISVNNTCFLSPFSNAWGCGRWFHKRMKFEIHGKQKYLESVLFSWKKSFELFRKRAASLNGFITMYFKKEYYGDIIRTADMLLEDEYSVFPSVSKVRNWGVDGSGQHSGKNNSYSQQIIDLKADFIIVDESLPVVEIASKLDYNIIGKFLTLLRYTVFRLFHLDILNKRRRNA